jgi:hypothetical protein
MIDEVPPPRGPSPEEIEEVFERLRLWGPEGDRIVEVHKKMSALLDEMIAKTSRDRQ